MDGGLVGLAGLVVVNIAAVAFSYGALNQKVKDIDKRLGRVEEKLDKIPGCKEVK